MIVLAFLRKSNFNVINNFIHIHVRTPEAPKAQQGGYTT